MGASRSWTGRKNGPGSGVLRLRTRTRWNNLGPCAGDGAMTEVEWRKLRAEQLREAARANAIVILPVASLEQHGPHLPVEVDSMLGETVAIRAARKMAARGQPALVLPVLWTGLSEHHMSFGGTVTLDFPTFFALI